MKNRFKSLIAGALAVGGALMLNGCSDDAVVQGHGAIAVKIGVDSHVINSVESRGDIDTLLGDITPEQLKIKLEHESGKKTYSFRSIDDFPDSYYFPIGKYAVTASYGDIETEGIDQPAFEGKADIEVFTNDLAPVNLTATLANSILQVDYTSNFKVYMKDYYCELNSSTGKKYTVPELDDEGTLFFKPGSTSVTVSFVRPDGKPGSVTLPQFDAQPQHLYKVTFDIDAQFGVAMLNIRFNDEKIAEVKSIDLSKDVDVVPAPYLVARGFDPTRLAPIDFIENVPYNQELDIQVIAMGGVQSVKLSTMSRALCIEGSEGNYFPKEIELIGASDADKELLRNYGLDVYGLWNKPDQMGIVDFSTVLKSIRYIGDPQHDLTSFTVVATDRYGRESAPMTLNLRPIELQLSLASSNGTEFQLGMYEEIAHVHVKYNGGLQFADQLRFEYTDENGNWTPTTVEEIQQTPTSSLYPGNDKYQLCAFVKVPGGTKDLKIHAHCGTKVSNDVEFKRVGSYMFFDQTYDPDRLNAFATRAKVHLNMGVIDRSSIELYGRKKGEGDDAWKKLESTPVSNASVAATVTVSGLEPNSICEIKAQAKKTMAGEEGEIIETPEYFEVITEKARQIESDNEISRFDEWTEVGAFHQKTNYILARVGQDYIARYFIGNGSVWKTRNELTTGQTSGDTPYYTSLSSTVPVSNGSGHAAEISAVGFGGGSTFTIGGGGNIRKRISGIMFLGDYSCSGEDVGSEVISYGIPFDSRPSGVKFKYKFKSQDGESFRALISVEHREPGADPIVIASNVFESAENVNDFTEYEIPVSYQDSPLKATHITISFLASTEPSTSTTPRLTYIQPSGDYSGNGYSNSKRIGNVLTIDDVELIY